MKRIAAILAFLILLTQPAFPQGIAEHGNTFEDNLSGLEHKPGFFDIYVDRTQNRLLAALPAPDDSGVAIRFIYGTGLTAGLGSNPIGLDRGAASSGVIVRFRRMGNRLVAEQENWRYRANADRAVERRAVDQSFASSFLWITDIIATSATGDILIDLSGFLTRDQVGIATVLKHGEGAGDYALAADRSFPDIQAALAFPDNVELDAYLTFETTKPNAETSATASDARAITLVQHHSFVRLPDDGYTPRKFDQRTANIGMGYYDYSAPLDDPIITRSSRRFRLERLDPTAASGPVRKPIVYYVDAGAPEQIRDALIEGASWWAAGFEAAGFENAYRVEILPEDAHPLDVRYNVINWVHRQTRGWSYGGSVSDPRTGEILKANVILGSQRVRQDRMIFEGLAGTASTGTGAADDPVELSLARIRQLAAHEVGHTLGFAHNFAASANDRASVMDYPAPYVRPAATGGLDFSDSYAVGLGAWDMFTVNWLYAQFPDGTDEDAALNRMVTETYASGLRFIGDADARSISTAHPFASVWDNGADAISTLEEVMQVRRIALDTFGLDRLAKGRPSSDLNQVIVPIYLYHRYQVGAAAKSIGGLDFEYGIVGEAPESARPVSPDEQRRALAALVATLAPAELDLPDGVINLLTPGDVGYAGTVGASETFPGRTGPVFDVLAAADISANLTLTAILDPMRANRLVALGRRDPQTLSLNETLAVIDDAIFRPVSEPRQAALAQMVQSRFISTLITLSRHDAASPNTSTIVDGQLTEMQARLTRRRSARTTAERVHFAALATRIQQHLDGIVPETSLEHPLLKTPPGSPIGSAPEAEDCWHCLPG